MIPQNLELDDVRLSFDGQKIEVVAGQIERHLRLTPFGLKTCVLRDNATGRVWTNDEKATGADWSVFVIADGKTPGELLDCTLQKVEADPFTSDHLRAQATFRFAYLDSHFDLRWSVWVYPHTSGMRTQIALKAGREFDSREIPTFWSGSFTERFALDIGDATRRAAGFYNDTQHRNFEHTPLLKEEVRCEPLAKRESYDWANLLCLESANGGLALVKESHKCVNQIGFDTGAFVLWPDEIGVSGVGFDEVGNFYLPSKKLNITNRFVEAWATWIIGFESNGDTHAGATAIKRFDRARFAPRIERDCRVKANTWGTRGSGDASRAAATQENLLREIASCADLGVDLLEIDDGWQCHPDGLAATSQPIVWAPNAARFPDGWNAVRDAAAQSGVELALWSPGNAPESEILANLEAGDFAAVKLDFLNFKVREELDEFFAKVRRLSAAHDHRLRVNFDATENMVRTGYFLGRETGPLFLSNRELPGLHAKHVVYHPHLQLREAWHLAHYFNLNQALLTVDDPDSIAPELSDAHFYSHSYCFATAMMGLPLFFLETQALSPAARDELRPLIALYKAHREAIFEGFVSPLGDEPNGANWTGFLSVDKDGNGGYATIFRELHNGEPRHSFALPLDKPARWTNLLTDETGALDPASGTPTFELESASFGFYRYEL